MSTRVSEYSTPADRRRGQHMCAMAHQLFGAMATGDVVRVDTTQGVVTGCVTSNEHHRAERPVEEVDGGRLVFTIGGQRVHVATVREVSAP